MSHMLQPGIILLREGTDQSQGKAQLISNINACQAVVDAVRTTLGPRGMDKLIFDGRKVTISNDGATIMKLLDIAHPAAKVLVDVSVSQDAEVGDGTTTVVLLSGEVLKHVKGFIEDGVNPQVIIRGLRRAGDVAIARLNALSVKATDDASARAVLEKCAGTALNSKLIASQRGLFAPMIVEAVSLLDARLADVKMVGIKKVPGGSVTDSFLVRGVAFKKTFSYAGFEQQPKHFENPKILLLSVELELKSEKENAEVRISDPDAYQAIVDAEWSIIYEKLDACVAAGAQIILSKLPIGDLATQYFADRQLFCAGRVEPEDMERISRATGGRVQSTTSGIEASVLGTCEKFEEVQLGEERFNLFTGCPKARTATIVLRGGSEQFLEESQRSMHDALMVVKRSLKACEVVAGGGAIEMELSKALREASRAISGKEQLVMGAVAKALEIVPRQLSENAGLDSTDVLNRLRHAHAQPGDGGRWIGVSVDEEDVCDTMAKGVWEPTINKRNALRSAIEAACLILSIDETVRNPQSEQPGAPSQGVGLGRGGQPISAGMGGMGMAGMMGAGRGKLPRGVRAMKGRAGA
ncbi:chaperonin Cpn60/TCP-1 family [Tribonema minus]|uniref:T-complex protein 1 subunit eta n=1 Tax=Tribonema minus TaxID=303371 RepID=A0A836CEV1_9STRA|nr:chaperonin Cpn60/TCP-1 family [Tribonema minus]